MTVKTLEIMEQLKSISLLEVAELVKQIEREFGVDASPKVLPVVKIEEENSNKIETLEPTEFDVILEEVPPANKIAILKAVRTITGLGLKETKDLVDSVPKVIKFAIAPDLANEIKQQLEAIGAKVSFK